MGGSRELPTVHGNGVQVTMTTDLLHTHDAIAIPGRIGTQYTFAPHEPFVHSKTG